MENTYAILGATGNCGTALIQNLSKNPTARIHAYCRNQHKLLRLLPQLAEDKRTKIFEGSLDDLPLIAACMRGCHAVFLAVSTNDNVPGCHMAQDTAKSVIKALRLLQDEETEYTVPRLVLLSSATVDELLSKNTPPLIHWILQRSASHVYKDLLEAEKLLRAQDDWLSTVFIKPGGLSVDEQRGHALSLVEEKSPLSYLDLAAAMIEAADEVDGRYDGKNVGVTYAEKAAMAPRGALLCIFTGILRHYMPFLHPYLPATGPY